MSFFLTCLKTVLAISSVFSSLQTFSFVFSPLETTLTKDQPSGLLSLKNDSAVPIAIEITIKKRVVDLWGGEKQLALSEAENQELIVFPEQIILGPKQKKTVKVRWLTPSVTKHEKSYRVIVEQLPIDMQKDKKKKSGIKVLLRYVGSLYLVDHELKNNPKLMQVMATPCGKLGKMVLTFINGNKSHQILNDLSLEFSTTGTSKKKKKVVVTSKQLKGISGENIMGKGTRKFKLKCSSRLKSLKGKMQISANYK